MRVFLDANILFSDAKSDGAIRRLLDQLIELGHELIVDAYVVTEARRNLERKYSFGIQQLERRLDQLSTNPHAHTRLDPEYHHLLPEKDQPVLAAALALNCAVLLTGDRAHFGDLYSRELGTVRILSPRQLAEILPWNSA